MSQLRRRMKAEDRRVKATALYLRGVPAEEIARRHGVHRKTTFQDLRIARQRMREEQVENHAEYTALMVARYEQVIRQAWRGWRRSLKNAESTSTTTGGDDDKTTTKSEGQAGNPSFLAEINKALWRICELRGLTGKDREAREEAQRQIQPLIGLIINSREELEMLKNMRSITIDQATPYLPAPGGQNGRTNGHHNGDDDDAD